MSIYLYITAKLYHIPNTCGVYIILVTMSALSFICQLTLVPVVEVLASIGWNLDFGKEVNQAFSLNFQRRGVHPTQWTKPQL